MKLELATIALLILAAITGNVDAKINYRSLNGIRLAGGTGPKGRLEISSKDSWFAEYGTEKAAWSGVCDGDSFTDDTARVMCNLLDYKYGRKYFNPKVAYRKNATADPPIGRIFCSPKNDNRRLLRGASDTAVAVLGDENQSNRLIGNPNRHGNRRSLYQPLSGTINTPSKAEYSCYFYAGPCEPNGPLAGIECSHKPLLRAPPPPPLPPRPPPAPPAVSNSIRMVGGYADDMNGEVGSVEPNLCSSETEDNCQYYGRVEVQVASPAADGTEIWAPLCASDPASSYFIAGIVCGQVYDWPKPLDGGIELVVPEVSEEPFAIPSGPVTDAGAFDPAKYLGWVTITGGNVTLPRKIQDLQYEVTAAPCTDGGMMAVYCQAWSSRRL